MSVVSFTSLIRRKHPLIIAHRGASAVTRENTLDAFATAIEMGADAVEMDIRRTSDGVIVVHHDARIKKARLPIRKVTYKQAAGSAKKLGYHLPTLDEVLTSCAGRISVDLELKEAGHEKSVCDLAFLYFERRHVIFKSFQDRTVCSIKRQYPEAIAGLLLDVGSRVRRGQLGVGLRVTTRLERCDADFVGPHYSLARRRFIERMQRLNIPVLVWTVDNEKRAARLADYGVQGIITNEPDKIARVIRG